MRERLEKLRALFEHGTQLTATVLSTIWQMTREGAGRAESIPRAVREGHQVSRLPVRLGFGSGAEPIARSIPTMKLQPVRGTHQGFSDGPIGRLGTVPLDRQLVEADALGVRLSSGKLDLTRATTPMATRV